MFNIHFKRVNRLQSVISYLMYISNGSFCAFNVKCCCIYIVYEEKCCLCYQTRQRYNVYLD